jgi:hypothetical protein
VRLIVVLLVAGCGRIAFDPLGGDGGTMTGDAVRDGGPLVCGAWSSTATRLDSLCTAEQDWEPAIHPSGDLLVFSSVRQMPGVSMEMYQATRTGPMTFGAPSLIATISTVGDAFDGGGAWNSAGDELTFSSDRINGRRLYVSAYSGGTFGAPAMIPELANQSANAPTLRGDGLEMYFDDYNGMTTRIYRATRTSTASPWVVVGVQTQLDPGGVYGWPSLAPDGLTLYYEGTVGVQTHLYEAHRATTSDAFGAGTVITDFDPVFQGPGDPDFSWDGTTLYFAATLVLNSQAADLYLVTRTCN